MTAKMIRNTVTAFLSALVLGGCAQIEQVSYATNCAQTAPEVVRSAVVRDLCQQFGKRATLDAPANGYPVACDTTLLSGPLARMFVASRDSPSFMNGASVAYIYLLPWKTPVELSIDNIPADDHILAEEVTRAVQKSFGNSGCTWTVRQKQYTQTPKLG